MSNNAIQQAMSVTEFLQRDLLRRSDVILCRGKKSLFARVIRWSTKSHFSHAGLVFLVPQQDRGFNNTFLIESIINGVDITDLKHYLIHKASDYDVVIKRFEADWFTAEHQRRVRGYMLDYIKAKYDFQTVWQIAKAVAGKLLFGARALSRGFANEIERSREKGRWIPGHFICSGFVQYGFYTVVRQLIERGELEQRHLEEILFKEFDGPPRNQDLLAVTPEDLARAPSLTWKYVITRGTAYPVNSQAEAYRLLNYKNR